MDITGSSALVTGAASGIGAAVARQLAAAGAQVVVADLQADKGEALAAEIPHAHYEVVRGMGHVFFSPGLPERLADLIAQADRRLAAAQAASAADSPVDA